MHLPIAKFRERIVKTVDAHQVTIIVAETGSGKSTQVPQYLLEVGYRLTLTQPRRLAARAVANRIAQEQGLLLGGVIGLNTRYEKSFSKDTRCLVATDGLVLIREFMGQNGHDVLILDEVHEWNIHTETLIALAKRAFEMGAGFKLVIMSATIDAKKLSEFFDGAPIITISERQHKIKRRPAGSTVEEDAEYWLKQGKNVLVFQPGKKEVTDTIEALNETLGDRAIILPLHAQLNPIEQARCFAHYGKPKCIVATPIAQTSITIDDIFVVVDSGLENRSELHGGVVGLYERVISHADAEQRMGRVGRTGPGIYIDHSRFAARDEYPLAEILRTRLDQLVLRLAWSGFDAESISFFHQPSKETFRQARDSLRGLGCLRKNGAITDHGRRVAALPVSVEAACMLLEAERRGVLPDMMTIAAIYDVGGIVASAGGPTTGRWKEFCPEENESDLLAQLAVYHGLQSLSLRERQPFFIREKAFESAIATRAFLERSVKEQLDFSYPPGDRGDLIASIAAGLKNHVYMPVKNERKLYHRGDGLKRKLLGGTVVNEPGLVVGWPWDISGDVDGAAKQFLCMVTKIGPDTLRSLTV